MPQHEKRMPDTEPTQRKEETGSLMTVYKSLGSAMSTHLPRAKDSYFCVSYAESAFCHLQQKNLTNPCEWDAQKESSRSHLKHLKALELLEEHSGIGKQEFPLEEQSTRPLRFILILRFYKNVFSIPLENSSLLPPPSW